MDSQEPQETQDPSPSESPVETPQVESSAPQEQSDLEADVDVDDLFDPDLPDDEPSEEPEQGGGEDFEAYKNAVTAMLRGGPGAANAARRVLMETGFSREEADNFVANAGYEPAPQSGGTEPSPPTTDPRLLQGLEEANRRAALAEERARSVRAKQLEQEMDYRLYEAVSAPELAGFIQKMESLNEGEDDKSRNDRRQVLVQEIRRTALENLGNRTRKSNRFDEGWISEEVGRASSQVMGRYRTAIGNIDRLGRSSVAVGPEEELRRSKPVAPPAWKPGKQVTDMDTEIRDWTVDVLSRAALDGGTGESKL